MVINAYWDNNKFLSVHKVNNYYITNTKIEDIEKVLSIGMPFYLLKDINIISRDMPKIIKDRIPKPENVLEDIRENNILDKNIVKFINSTKCYIPTDKLTINIEI